MNQLLELSEDTKIVFFYEFLGYHCTRLNFKAYYTCDFATASRTVRKCQRYLSTFFHFCIKLSNCNFKYQFILTITSE